MIVQLRGLAPAMARAGMSGPEVARALGVSRQAVDYWVRGTKWPNPDRLPALAELLGVTIDELYTGNFNEEVST